MDLTVDIRAASPQKIRVAFAEYLTGLMESLPIQAPCAKRDATGQGCPYRLALLDSLPGKLANQAMKFSRLGRAPTRMGNAHPQNIVPYQVFRRSDAARDHRHRGN